MTSNQPKTVERVYKYGTGEIIPEGAKYLTTVVEEKGGPTSPGMYCRFVWHYFLVKVQERE